RPRGPPPVPYTALFRPLDGRAARADATSGWGAHAQAKVAARVFEAWITDVTAEDPALADAAASHLEASLRDELLDRPEAESLVRDRKSTRLNSSHVKIS